MARIRSIHPGLFMDDHFVELSDRARWFFIGLLTDCDDFGAFEWKPKTLKRKLMAAENADADPLLEELVRENFIRRYEIDGQAYGVVRNWHRWQRPQKPKAIHPVPPELRSYTGLTEADAEPVQDKSRTSTIPVQDQSENFISEGGGRREDEGWRMEDGGGRREEVGAPAATRLNAFEFATELCALAKFPKPESRAQREIGVITAWLGSGFDPDLDIRSTIRDIASRENFRCDGLTYFTKMIRERHEGRSLEIPGNLRRSAPPRERTDAEWRVLLTALRDHGRWHKDAGPPPGRPGCLVPPAILAEFGFGEKPPGKPVERREAVSATPLAGTPSDPTQRSPEHRRLPLMAHREVAKL